MWPLLPALMAIMAGACATVPGTKPPASGPSEWIADIDFADARCANITGTFQNLGERRDSSGRVTQDGLLAEQVFLRQLPVRRVAQTVSITSAVGRGWLNATLVGGVSRDIGFAVSCENGWHSMTETRSGQYMGDGVVQEKFRQISNFRLDRKGRLVARVFTEATYRTDYQDVSEESSETWYRFEPTHLL